MIKTAIFLVALIISMPSWCGTVVAVDGSPVQQDFSGTCSPKNFTPGVTVQINYYNASSIPSSLSGASSGSSFLMSSVTECGVAGHVSFYQSAGGDYAVQIDDARNITGDVVIYLMYMDATDSNWISGETVN